MKNIFLAPRSNETSYENFESTIIKGRNYAFLKPYLTEAEIETLFKNKEGNISIWGNKNSLRARWEKMVPGDYVLFYAKGAFYYSARVVLTKYSKDLGLALWPADEDGEPWPCIFFLEDVKEIHIPIGVLQELADYKSSWDRVQGFMPLNQTGLEAIVEKFGSIEAFIGQPVQTFELIEKIIKKAKEESVEGERISEVAKEKVLREAQSYQDSGESHVLDSRPRKVRVENRQQKKRIAELENYSCQICNWSLEWTNSKGKKVYRIDVDHIVDKAEKGGEEIGNLWALCPNCHTKKTLGVIAVDLVARKVFENGKEVKLHHDSHLKWNSKNI